MCMVGSDKVIDKGLSDSIGRPLGEGSSLRMKESVGRPEKWGEHDVCSENQQGGVTRATREEKI